MSTRQPDWRLLTNIGDASPLDYGGLFVYEDSTGVYPPEMVRLERDNDDDDSTFEVRRVILNICTFTNGVLSYNPFHPNKPAWFADQLSGVASFIGSTTEELQADICADDTMRRAHAYRAIYDHSGWDNGDSYPLTLTLAEATARYANPT